MTRVAALRRFTRGAVVVICAALLAAACTGGGTGGSSTVTAADVDLAADGFAAAVRALPEALRTSPSPSQVGVTADPVLEDQATALDVLERTLEPLDGAAGAAGTTLLSAAEDLTERCTELVDAYEVGDQAAAQAALDAIAADAKTFDTDRDKLVTLLSEE